VSLNRRYLPCLAAVLALLVTAAPSALASTHPARTTRISGVVTAINARRHTLELRVAHSGRRHRAGARAAAAGGFQTVVVAFGDATVKGPDGAVAVGDDVTVTTDGPAGPTAVASAIDVIGTANGGSSGQGAAVPGEVTAVDPAEGTLTLAVSSTDSQGQSQASSVIVTVSASTILAVGASGDQGQVTLADISVGDHVVVFTDDAGVDPIAALAILDATRPGGNQQGGGDPSPVPRTRVPGTVTAIDAGAQSLSIAVSDGPLAGETVTVDTSDHTSFGGAPGAAGPFGFSDVSVGDSVVVYTPDPTASPIVAVGVVDGTPPAGGGSGGGSGGTGPPTPPTSPPSAPQRFGGVVTAVRGDGLTVTVVSSGDLTGQSVVVSVPPTTSFQADPQTGAGKSLSTISIGDAVEIFTDNETGSPIVAVGVSDDGVYSAS